MKKILSALLILVLCVGAAGNAYAVQSDDEEAIKSVIENYYSSSYDMWWNLEMGDLSEYLDMNSIQSYNAAIYLESNIETWKYLIEKEYFKGTRERNDVNFDFEAIDITGNTAEVKVVLSNTTNSAAVYPGFIILGENTFKLTKTQNRWLITEQDHSSDPNMYNLPKTEMSVLDLDEIMNRVDSDFSPSKDATDNNSSISSGAFAPMAIQLWYSPSRAVSYANDWYDDYNTTMFATAYDANGDIADCTNFVCQCVAYGFGSTTAYDAINSYGTLGSIWSRSTTNWVSASGFWDHATSATKTLGVFASIKSLAQCQNGTIMQIDWTSNGSWDHSTICVDAANLLFAQHTGNHIWSYADLAAGPYTRTFRFMHPGYLRIN